MNEEKIIRQESDFRLVLRKTACASPENLFHVELENQHIKEEKVVFSSNYSFFLTKEELQKLAQSLV